jgi:drug/metabolite transporter (DMT)-like permease
LSLGVRPGRGAAVLALTFNAFVWGVAWWPFRELQSQGLHPLWATAFIYIVSLAVLMVWQPRAFRGWGGHPQLWLLAAAAGFTNVGFNWAVTVGDVVRVVLLFYLMPAWSVLLAWPLLGERPTAASLLRLVLALAGVLVVLKQPGVAFPLPQSLPDVLALLGGLCFALTNILLRRLHAAPSQARVGAMFAGGTLTATTVAMLGGWAGVVAAPVIPAGTGLAFALLLSLGFLAGNAALQYGASRLAAQTTALVMLSELLFASLSSIAAGAAELTLRTLAGGALILAAAAWSALAPERG